VPVAMIQQIGRRSQINKGQMGYGHAGFLEEWPTPDFFSGRGRGCFVFSTLIYNRSESQGNR
jgi:hypothetical protein